MNPIVWCFGIGIMACLPPEDRTTTVTVCPYAREWSAADQAAVANELGRLGIGSASARAIGNYANLREQVAACERRKKAKAKRP